MITTYKAVPTYVGWGPSRTFSTLPQAREYAERCADAFGSPYSVWEVRTEGAILRLRCVARFAALPAIN
jgi:hypothetical protein